MEILKKAVDAGIISNAQRLEIEALEQSDPRGFTFSLVHLLWLGGAGLIVFALVLLAGEVSRGQPVPLMWICLVYAGGLACLDWALARRSDMRLLSSLVNLAMAVSVMFAADAAFGLQSEDWYPMRNPEAGLLVLAAFSAALVWRRGFLPAWITLSFAALWLAMIRLDPFMTYKEEPYFFLGASAFGMGLTWVFDLRSRSNHGFWLNKVALFCFTIYAFWVAFGRGWEEILLFASLVLLAVSLFLRRPVGVSAGAIGLGLYLAEWLDAWDNVLVAAGILGVVGLGAIFIGVKAHLVEDQLERLLPGSLKRLRPNARQDPVTFGF